jgi:hypothetical protein
MSAGVSESPSRIRRVLPLLVSLAAVIASAAYLVWKVGGIGTGRCGQAIGAAQEAGIVAACVVAFFAGHWAQRLRHEERDPMYAARSAGEQIATTGPWDTVAPGRLRTFRRATLYVRTGTPTRSSAWKSGSLITYGVLILFYGSGLFAIVYEAISLWPGATIPSITTLVRCARNADVGWTIVVAGTVSFLAGHWLWAPARTRNETAQ